MGLRRRAATHDLTDGSAQTPVIALRCRRDRKQADRRRGFGLWPVRLGVRPRRARWFKDATVKRYFYETHDQLRVHLQNFVDAYNFARRLKTLRGLTPYEFVCKAWTSEPHRFKLNPLQQTPGLNI